jgi:nucleotide-binding universal stress UspA family protein
MYKKIICPIDGSSVSEIGMTEAIRLAKDQNAKLLFLHVIGTYAPILDMSGDLNVIYLAEILRNNGKKIVEQAEKSAQAAGVTAESKIVESLGGSVSEFVLTQAAAWSADLIVMGTHGLRGIERLLVGSDAEAVVRMTPIPVLLLRDKLNASLR